ncbi:hypothetical protein ACFL54_06440 [Planctomycetota bacterium]
MENLEFEQSIRRLDCPKASAELPDRIFSDFQARGRSGENRFAFFLRIAMTACACLLVGLAIFHFTRQKGASNGGATGTEEITRNLAVDSFYVLKTEPVNQESVIQDFDAFLIRRLRVGSAVGGFTLVEVEEDALKLKDKDGLEERFLVQNLNAESLRILEQETANLAKAFRTGKLQDADLDRLENISSFGGKSVLRLLDDIAVSDSKWRSKSETILKANEELSSLRNVIKWAKTGSRGTRLVSIRSLAEIKSPLAAQCLKDIVYDPDEELAMLALGELLRQNDEFLFTALETIVREVPSEKVIARAQSHLDKILKGVKHDR